MHFLHRHDDPARALTVGPGPIGPHHTKKLPEKKPGHGSHFALHRRRVKLGEQCGPGGSARRRGAVPPLERELKKRRGRPKEKLGGSTVGPGPIGPREASGGGKGLPLVVGFH